MRIVICNVPLRSEGLKTAYPPLGPLAIIQSLRSSGHDAVFYDINSFRPSDADIVNYFLENKYDVIGISATVSTSYEFVKKIGLMIKSISKKTPIVVGGALTASSEILLKFAGVDFCVLGEGEKIIVNLVNYISTHGIEKSYEELKRIKGVCFLKSGSDEVIFTGYEDQLSLNEIRDPDYGIIEKYSNIDNYVISPSYYEQFDYDERSFEESRRGKRLATIITSRGCVNRCTFCYRGQRGIRILPVDRVISHIKSLMLNYNVGFISFGDEDFGASKRWLEEFTEKVKSLDILYRIAAICVTNVDFSILKKIKESGCVSVHYGFESGSNKILKVMEKSSDVDLNIKVARWTYEANLQTVYALVVGMPGESYHTIRETTDFVKRITEFLPKKPVISINALVVLPGTPVYEYARYRGLLGKTLADEEKYLLRISDKGGVSMKQLNITDYPYFIVLGWIRCIYIAARYNYYKKKNLSVGLTRHLLSEAWRAIFGHNKSNASLVEDLYGHPLIYHLRYIISPLLVMYKSCKEDTMLFLQRCLELLIRPFKNKTFTSYISLRSFLNKESRTTKEVDPASIQILRLGR